MHKCGTKEKSVCLYEADGAAIWDIQVLKGEIFAAEDSGRVVSVNSETLKVTEIYVSSSISCLTLLFQCALNESALCLSVDVMNKVEPKAIFLSVGTNSKVTVFRKDLNSEAPFEKVSQVSETSDNVSCVKTIQSEKGFSCIFGTHNGRIAHFDI